MYSIQFKITLYNQYISIGETDHHSVSFFLAIKTEYSILLREEVETMLVAKQSNGRLFVLDNSWTREELKILRQKEQFTCPQCHRQLQLKIGSVNNPHFAHRQEEACEQYFSEGETHEHIQGKLDLYSLFQKIPLTDVQLEPYLAELKQRPDLLIRHQHHSKPIEFQVSRIPVEQIIQRTTRYVTHGYDPLWILHTPSKMIALKEGPVIYSLNSFERQFLTHLHKYHYLFTYYPQAKTFHYISHFMHIENHKYIVNHRKLSLVNQRYPFATPKSLSKTEVQQYIQVFQQERARYIRSALYHNRKGINHLFLRSCYEMRMIPTLLPSWIGLPVAFDDGFISHACEWQMTFLYYLSTIDAQLEVGDRRYYKHFLQQYYSVNILSLSAVEAYHSLLIKIGYKQFEGKAQLPEQKKLSVILSEYLQK